MAPNYSSLNTLMYSFIAHPIFDFQHSKNEFRRNSQRVPCSMVATMETDCFRERKKLNEMIIGRIDKEKETKSANKKKKKK